MKTPRILLAALLATSVAGAFAQQPEQPKTRAQVKAELADAIRAGDIPFGETGRTLAESNPSRYPQAQQAPGLDRAQVVAELAQARRDGDVQVGDAGHTLAEIDPSAYPQAPRLPGLTRAEVKAELARAIRDGDISVGDRGESLAQQAPQRYAAQRARDGESRYASN